MKRNIRLLSIDDDRAFADLLIEHLTDEVQDVNFTINWIPDMETECDITLNYDLYLVDNRINGFPKAKQIISTIRSKDRQAMIFVVSGHADFDLIKDLCNMKISGFIDKENLDITPLIEASRQTSLREKLSKLVKKTDELREHCKM